MSKTVQNLHNSKIQKYVQICYIQKRSPEVFIQSMEMSLTLEVTM